MLPRLVPIKVDKFYPPCVQLKDEKSMNDAIDMAGTQSLVLLLVDRRLLTIHAKVPNQR